MRTLGNFSPLGCGIVIAHAEARKRRGKKPSRSFCHIKNPKLALQAALRVANLELLNVQPHFSICQSHPDFTIHTMLFSDSFLLSGGGRETWVKLNFGLLQFTGTNVQKFANTYLIEIDIYAQYGDHARESSTNDFRGDLSTRYEGAVYAIAIQFAQILGLQIRKELQYFPVLKFVVECPPQKIKNVSQKNRYDSRLQ